jgi:glyoxylase-like metal-dependent hydrolase (beta-lactamase superfamily II)
MKLYVLDLGKIVMKAANPVTSGEGAEEAAIPIHAFLIDRGEEKILFDAGCHPEAMTGAWPKEMCENPYVFDEDATLLNRLAQIHVRPEEITTLVVSHLHLDHAGCIHLFPNATVYVQETELKKTMEDYDHGCSDVFHLSCDIEEWKKADVKWKTVCADSPVELAPGVSIIDLKAGHSFGMLALMVQLNQGTFLLVADAAYSAFHYGPPAELSGAVYDEEGYFAAMETIRKLEKENNGTVLFGHDMEQFHGLKKSTEGYYE